MYERFYKRHLKKVRTRRNEVQGLCPFHEDKNPSFSANLQTGQWYCFGCCKSGNALTFAKEMHIQIQSVPNYQAEYYKTPTGKQIIAEYDYYDEQGVFLYQVVRYQPKGFRIRRPDGHGNWFWNLKGVRLIPYYLPEVINGQDVLICEGEKDADLLRNVGFCATCNPMGAGKWRKDYNQYFRGKDVVILPDNDDPGKNHAKHIANDLITIAKTVKLVFLPVGKKQDASDYLREHNSNHLKELIQSTDFYKPHLERYELKKRVIQLSTLDNNQQKYLWKPYIPVGKLTLIEEFSVKKISLVGLAIAAACSVGFGLPDTFYFQLGSVLFLHPEKDPQTFIKPQLDVLGANCEKIFAIQGIFPFDKVGLELLTDSISMYKPTLVIIDSIYDYLQATMDLRELDSITPVLATMSRLANENHCAICLINYVDKEPNSKDNYRRISSIEPRNKCQSVLKVNKIVDGSTIWIVNHIKSALIQPGKPIRFKQEHDNFRWMKG
jgi:putative DNA primase/helicase